MCIRDSRGGAPREDRYAEPREFDRASISRYERERRERDAERERAYITRADPYAKAADLDYGDSSDGPGNSRPGSSHGGKRAGSESRRGNERAAKRPRTEGGLRSEDTVAKIKQDKEGGDKEEIALQSGSEEGEIEEV